jgi:hypothetical protein
VTVSRVTDPGASGRESARPEFVDRAPRLRREVLAATVKKGGRLVKHAQYLYPVEVRAGPFLGRRNWSGSKK